MRETRRYSNCTSVQGKERTPRGCSFNINRWSVRILLSSNDASIGHVWAIEEVRDKEENINYRQRNRI